MKRPVTKDEFLSYETVRRSGYYNMYDPMAIELSGLDGKTYLAIMDNYSELKDKYMEDNNNGTN
tara:strand:- start:1018 stop:1209 length:192 start_codon:yes stop_codon:yes gene_type:complete